MTKLTAERVSNTVRACLYADAELPADGSAPEGAKLVRGVIRGFGFDPARVEANRPAIREMLDELPDTFRQDVGGGWSFLNACMDKDGNQWGEHINIDELLALGLAADLVEFPLPREFWPSLPGGMPYFAIKPEPVAA